MVSEAWTGQTVTIYAMGSLAAAIPLTAATQGVRRRPLLLAAIAGFAIANTVTALSSNYVLTMIARFLAGVSAGLLWAMLAGYAARMVPEHQQGRAIAIAMVGTPLALSLGVPAGTFLGNLLGWRMCFGIMSGLALALMAWVQVKLPDFAGQAASKRLSLGHVFTFPVYVRCCSWCWPSFWRTTSSIPISRHFSRRQTWRNEQTWFCSCSASLRCWASGSSAC
jgi:predicted MFS family arabinose efflux permease